MDAQMDRWMDELEQVFVNAELQVIADELKDEVTDAQWEELIGMQFLTLDPASYHFEE